MPTPVDTLYETYIRSLSLAEKLELRERLNLELENEEEEKPLTRNRPWSELYGTMPNLLNGEDAQEYISRIRKEMDR